MTQSYIRKYYYHEYVLFTFLILLFTGIFAIFFFNFSPTQNVLITALIIASFCYVAVLLYFFYLYKKQDWVIPRSWKNVRRRPKFYFLFLFPCAFVLVLWLNLIHYIPYLHTAYFGSEKIIQIDATVQRNYSKKGAYYYSFKTPYKGVRIFKITPEQYQFYAGHPLQITLSVVEGPFGTNIKKIHDIRIINPNSINNK